jgi:hypothetical protein
MTVIAREVPADADTEALSCNSHLNGSLLGGTCLLVPIHEPGPRRNSLIPQDVVVPLKPATR